MSHVIRIDPALDPRWDDFVRSHRFGSVYHLSNWSEVLRKTFSYTPCFFALEERRAISAGLSFMRIDSWLTGKRSISLPGTPYCDPLTETEDQIRRLLDPTFDEIFDGHAIYLEIKTQFNARMLENGSFLCYRPFRNHILSLEKGKDLVWKTYRAFGERKEPGATGEVSVRRGEKLKDVKILHELLAKSARKTSIPARPLSLLVNIWEGFPKDLLLLLIAECNGAPCAALLGFLFKDRFYCEFLGADDQYREHRPEEVLVWEAIEAACKRKLKFFDFGLTRPEDLKTMDLHRRWGAVGRDLCFYYFPDAMGCNGYAKRNGSSAEVGDSRLFVHLKRYAAGKLYRHLG